MRCSRCRLKKKELSKAQTRCNACRDKDREATRARRKRNRDIDRNIEKSIPFYEKALEYAVGNEVVAGEALVKYGSVLKASEALGVSPSSLRKMLGEIKVRAARRGYSPEHDMTCDVPAGFSLKGVSTLYKVNEEGVRVPSVQWVKSKTDEEHKYQRLLDAMQASLEGYQALPVVAPPNDSNEDLLAVYPMGDPHFGMYAWAEETGADFDLEIARRTLFAAVDNLVELAPPAKYALIANLGDFFHMDNTSNMTMKSGNQLDVDTRWTKVMRVGIDTMIRCVERALEKHETVRVVNEVGNHDDHSSLMLSMCMEKFFSDNPRVEIDMSPKNYHYLRFGNCLLGIHHGHGAKPTDLGGIMSVDRPKDWGETKYRHWYTGHVHHDRVKDLYGCTFESFRTLAANDKWHHSEGYRSDKDMKCDIWHREHGRRIRYFVGVRELGNVK